MITLVPTTADHMRAVELRAFEELEREQALGHAPTLEVLQVALSDYSRALLKDGRPIACFGIWLLWPGVGRAWSLISNEARTEHPKSVFKAAKGLLEFVEQRDSLLRVDATVRTGDPRAHAFLRRLKFEREGLMKNYGMYGVGDAHLYARTRRWEPKLH